MAECEPPNKKRKMKTSLNQFQIYLDMLESNVYFRENKVSPDNPDVLKKSWEQLVENLNSSGGPKKNLNEWKRVFTDWKSQVRKRARLLKNTLRETGNVGEPEKELTELEKKLLHLTGDIVIEGLTGVPEIGLENDVAIEKAVNEEKNKVKIIKVKQNEDKNILKEINENLKKLITIQEKKLEMLNEELALKRLKLTLKYNIQTEGENQ